MPTENLAPADNCSNDCLSGHYSLLIMEYMTDESMSYEIMKMNSSLMKLISR